MTAMEGLGTVAARTAHGAADCAKGGIINPRTHTLAHLRSIQIQILALPCLMSTIFAATPMENHTSGVTPLMLGHVGNSANPDALCATKLMDDLQMDGTTEAACSTHARGGSANTGQVNLRTNTPALLQTTPLRVWDHTTSAAILMENLQFGATLRTQARAGISALTKR